MIGAGRPGRNKKLHGFVDGLVALFDALIVRRYFHGEAVFLLVGTRESELNVAYALQTAGLGQSELENIPVANVAQHLDLFGIGCDPILQRA